MFFRIPEHRQKLRLILIGSVRHEEDKQRVEQLRTLVENLNLNEEVEFKLNINFIELTMIEFEASKDFGSRLFGLLLFTTTNLNCTSLAESSMGFIVNCV